jgi:hypothetical protein
MSRKQGRRALWWVPVAVGGIVSVAVLVSCIPEAVDAYRRAGFDDPYFVYVLVGSGATLIALAISLLVRDRTAQIVYAIIAVAISMSVAYSWLVYEEWLEYQPGGRGYYAQPRATEGRST